MEEGSKENGGELEGAIFNIFAIFAAFAGGGGL